MPSAPDQFFSTASLKDYINAFSGICQSDTLNDFTAGHLQAIFFMAQDLEKF